METVDRLRLGTALVCSGLGLGLGAAPAIAAPAAAVADCEMVTPDGGPSQDQFRLEGDRSLAPILRRDHARYLADRIDQTYHQMLTALEADQVILLGRCGEIYQRFAALQPEVDSLVAEAEAALGLIEAALAAQGLKHNDGALPQPPPLWLSSLIPMKSRSQNSTPWSSLASTFTPQQGNWTTIAL